MRPHLPHGVPTLLPGPPPFLEGQQFSSSSTPTTGSHLYMTRPQAIPAPITKPILNEVSANSKSGVTNLLPVSHGDVDVREHLRHQHLQFFAGCF